MAWIVGTTALIVASPALGAAASDPRAPATLGAVASAAAPIGICAAALIILVILWRRDVIRPRSFSRGTRRDLSGMPALVWLVAGLMVLAASALGAGLAASLPAHLLGPTDSIRQDGIVGLAGYSLGIACGAFMLYLMAPRAAPAAGLSFRAKDLLVGVGCFLLAWPVLQSLIMISIWVTTMVSGPPDQVAHATLKRILEQRDDPWVYAVIAAAVLGAPIVEELTFRVFLQTAVVRLLGVWPGVLVTSALFALVHLRGDTVPWHTMPVLFGVGLTAGLAYERTRRPGVPIVMHVCFNLYNVVLALLFPHAMSKT